MSESSQSREQVLRYLSPVESDNLWFMKDAIIELASIDLKVPPKLVEGILEELIFDGLVRERTCQHCQSELIGLSESLKALEASYLKAVDKALFHYRAIGYQAEYIRRKGCVVTSPEGEAELLETVLEQDKPVEL